MIGDTRLILFTADDPVSVVVVPSPVGGIALAVPVVHCAPESLATGLAANVGSVVEPPPMTLNGMGTVSAQANPRRQRVPALPIEPGPPCPPPGHVARGWVQNPPAAVMVIVRLATFSRQAVTGIRGGGVTPPGDWMVTVPMKREGGKMKLAPPAKTRAGDTLLIVTVGNPAKRICRDPVTDAVPVVVKLAAAPRVCRCTVSRTGPCRGSSLAARGGPQRRARYRTAPAPHRRAVPLPRPARRHPTKTVELRPRHASLPPPPLP